MSNESLDNNKIIEDLSLWIDLSKRTDEPPFVTHTFLQQLLDLIKRLQAENENLKDILYDADGVNLVNYWYQQCKIAENGCKNFSEENEKLKSENTELYKSINEMATNVAKINEALPKMKVDAYNEFAEKILKDLYLLANHEDSFRQSVILGVCNTIKFKLKDLVSKAYSSTVTTDKYDLSQRNNIE